jgi:hypothetical protein
VPLYRAVYVRDARPKGITYWASTPATATEFAYIVIEGLIKALDKRAEVLTITPVKSRRRTR